MDAATIGYVVLTSLSLLYFIIGDAMMFYLRDDNLIRANVPGKKNNKSFFCSLN